MGRSKSTRANLKRRLAEWRSQPCLDCGRSDMPCTADHRDPSTKLMSPATAVHKSRGALEAELAKCDPVCWPCHLKREIKRGTPGAEGAWKKFYGDLTDALD